MYQPVLTSLTKLIQHQKKLARCHLCSEMHGPAVHGEAVLSPVMLIGQAPGSKEIMLHKPFAWTAGKTLFGWFESIGMDENNFRQQVYMSAVCRCFPGKKVKAGDRVPNVAEIENCSEWLHAEVDILRPELIIPVGKLAINQIRPINKLSDIVGQVVAADIFTHACDVIALPHPSGASTWYRSEPGNQLLQQALKKIHQHPAWQDILSKNS